MMRASFLGRVAGIALGVVALASASQVDLPMWPVPMTLQTLAVLVIGAAAGARWGAVTVLLWLALGALGLPVFADGASGLARFAGPTGGYLVAFPIAAALTGWLAARGWLGRWHSAIGAMLIGHAICLGLGGAWLATRIGIPGALKAGVAPFLFGAVVKSIAAAALAMWIARRRRFHA